MWFRKRLIWDEHLGHPTISPLEGEMPGRAEGGNPCRYLKRFALRHGLPTH